MEWRPVLIQPICSPLNASVVDVQGVLCPETVNSLELLAVLLKDEPFHVVSEYGNVEAWDLIADYLLEHFRILRIANLM